MKTARIKEGYGIIYKEVMSIKGISLTAKSIYALLISYTGQNKSCSLSINELIRDTGLCYKSVIKYMQELQKSNLVKIEKSTGIQNVYWPQKKAELKKQFYFECEKKGFGIIQYDVMRKPGISMTAKGVYALLVSCTDIGGSCFPKISSISEILDIAPNTVTKSINELEKVGLLLVKRQKRKINIYYPKHLIYSIKEQQKTGSTLELPFKSEAFERAWNEWLEYRNKINKPYKTEMSIKKLFNQLKKFDEEFSIKLINKSISSGYMGLVFVDTENQYKKLKEKSDDKPTDRLSFTW